MLVHMPTLDPPPECLERRASLDSHDLRRGGRWSFWQHCKNDLIYHAIRGAFTIADRMPNALLLECGRFIGDTTHLLAAGLRQRARARARNCSTLTGNHRLSDAKAITRASFIQAGENLCLSLLLRRNDVSASEFIHVGHQARRTLYEAVAEGHGVVFVSAHLGPFELIAARVAELGMAPAVVVRESYDPRIDPLVDAHRILRGIQVIHRGKPGAPGRMLRALRRCQPVGFLVDLPSRVRALRMPFLGAEVRIPMGPQRLARLTGAPLLVGTLRRRPERLGQPQFELRITRLVAKDEVELTRRVAHLLEREILARPEDWPWMA